MSAHQKLWAGSLRATRVVYDPGIQVSDNIYAIFFAVRTESLDIWRRALAKSIAKKEFATTDHAEASQWLERYAGWKTCNHLEIEQKQESVRSSQLRIVGMHRAFVVGDSMREYKGFLFVEEAKRRDPECRKCSSGLATVASLKCLDCGWIICHNCGACGCGWGQESS
jgi:hypothetical protein